MLQVEYLGYAKPDSDELIEQSASTVRGASKRSGFRPPDLRRQLAPCFGFQAV
jgi:hypothetical protein